MPSALADVEVGDERVDLLLVGRDLAPGLLERALGHEALGPDDDAGADAAEDDEQQQPLELGLAALPVHDEEADRGEPSTTTKAAAGALLRRCSAVAWPRRPAGARRQARRCFPTIQKHSGDGAAQPEQQRHEALGHRTEAFRAAAPRLVGILEVLDVA